MKHSLPYNIQMINYKYEHLVMRTPVDWCQLQSPGRRWPVPSRSAAVKQWVGGGGYTATLRCTRSYLSSLLSLHRMGVVMETSSPLHLFVCTLSSNLALHCYCIVKFICYIIMIMKNIAKHLDKLKATGIAFSFVFVSKSFLITQKYFFHWLSDFCENWAL